MLDGILAISGEPGLYKMISQTKNGIVVESIETKKRIPAYATNKISSLEDIAIFTDEDEVSLRQVFKSIKEASASSEIPTHKSNTNDIKQCFRAVLPNFDEDRVYVSDMKKVFRWFHILDKQEMLENLDEEEKTEETNE